MHFSCLVHNSNKQHIADKANDKKWDAWIIKFVFQVFAFLDIQHAFLNRELNVWEADDFFQLVIIALCVRGTLFYILNRLWNQGPYVNERLVSSILQDLVTRYEKTFSCYVIVRSSIRTSSSPHENQYDTAHSCMEHPWPTVLLKRIQNNYIIWKPTGERNIHHWLKIFYPYTAQARDPF